MDLRDSVKKLVESIDDRQNKVVKRRFGLFEFKKATLARIGADMNLTRERVRQIETAGLKELSENENLKTIEKELEKTKKASYKLGGIVVVSKAADIVIANSNRDKDNLHSLELILTLISDLKISKQNQEFVKYWYHKKYENKIIRRVAKEFEKILKEIDKPIQLEELISKFKKTGYGKKVKMYKSALEQIVSINKNIGEVGRNRVGLMNWNSINPKSAREKAYLILKKASKPLHYRQIAKLIKEEDFYSEHNPTAPTVHNEVILDDRFVLIGRGIYGLKEWGYTPGTVEEVIKSILKDNPEGLERSKIVNKVLDQRKVAKNTILANLNRKKDFKRKKDQVYVLR